MEIFIYSYSSNTFNQNLKSKLKKLVTNKRLRDLENFIANKRLIELNHANKRLTNTTENFKIMGNMASRSGTVPFSNEAGIRQEMAELHQKWALVTVTTGESNQNSLSKRLFHLRRWTSQRHSTRTD